MHTVKNFAFGLLAAAAVASASDVTQLKKDNFDEFIKSNDIVLAEFFAPWCGHCKALAPEYEEAATSLKEKNIKLVKVDCTEEADLCQSYGVEGYPTLKVFRGVDSPKNYGGARQTDSLVSYMTKQSMPAVSDVTEDNLEEFKTLDKIVIIGYVASDDKTADKSFADFAETQRDNYLFGVSHDAALAKTEGAKQPPSFSTRTSTRRRLSTTESSMRSPS